MDRKKYTLDESMYPELTILLDTYDISDLMTRDHLETVGSVMCKKGCSNCCKNPTVPFTEPELIGISWYATQTLINPLRDRLKQRLRDHEATPECPFLIDNECSVYDVRPLICRQFYVKNIACIQNEDIMSNRPEDIVAPIRSIAMASLMRLLDFWPHASMHEKEESLENGAMQDKTIYMHDCDWTQLANTMAIFDETFETNIALELTPSSPVTVRIG